jgi:hypothetical protein
MITHAKLVVAAAIISGATLLSSGSAQAGSHVDVGIGFGIGAPVDSAPYYAAPPGLRHSAGILRTATRGDLTSSADVLRTSTDILRTSAGRGLSAPAGRLLWGPAGLRSALVVVIGSTVTFALSGAAAANWPELPQVVYLNQAIEMWSSTASPKAHIGSAAILRLAHTPS